MTGWQVGGALAFRSSCLTHTNRQRLPSSFPPNLRPHPGDPGASFAPSKAAAAASRLHLLPAAAPTLGIHQRALRLTVDRWSEAWKRPNQLFQRFPFLPTPNLARGGCRRSKLSLVSSAAASSFSLTSTSCLSPGCV